MTKKVGKFTRVLTCILIMAIVVAIMPIVPNSVYASTDSQNVATNEVSSGPTLTTGNSVRGWLNGLSDLQSVQFVDTTVPETYADSIEDLSANGDSSVVGWFDGATAYISSQITGTKIVANASCRKMFYMCPATTYNFSNLDTSATTDMSKMFYVCGATGLNLSGLDTSSVTNMSEMFYGCYNLSSLDLSDWDTSSVTDMSSMFWSCAATSLDLSNWDTSNVAYMSDMFYGCNNLTSINVTGWDLSSGTNLTYLFSGCYNLTNLDLSSWTVASGTYMDSMFRNCSSLETIYVSNSWVATSGDNLFTGCDSLVGGAGTAYSSDAVDYTYAKIDGGTASPGYLTYREYVTVEN